MMILVTRTDTNHIEDNWEEIIAFYETFADAREFALDYFEIMKRFEYISEFGGKDTHIIELHTADFGYSCFFKLRKVPE